METTVYYRKTFETCTPDSIADGETADNGFVDVMENEWSINDPEIAKFLHDDTSSAYDNPLHDTNLIHECELSTFVNVTGCNESDVYVGADIYAESDENWLTGEDTRNAYHVTSLGLDTDSADTANRSTN